MSINFDGKPLYKIFLTPTRIYVKPVLSVLEKIDVHGMAHITGGGLPENLPRSLPDGLSAVVDKESVKIPPVFDFIKDRGVEEHEMWSTFNMGIGFVLILHPDKTADAAELLEEEGITAYEIGRVVKNIRGEKFWFV